MKAMGPKGKKCPASILSGNQWLVLVVGLVMPGCTVYSPVARSPDELGMINTMQDHTVYVTNQHHGQVHGWKVKDAAVDEHGLHGQFQVISQQDAARFNSLKGGTRYYPSGKYIVVKADSAWQVDPDLGVRTLLPRAAIQNMVVKERDRGKSKRNTAILVVAAVTPFIAFGIALLTFSGSMSW
jgi:hypothetical protein